MDRPTRRTTILPTSLSHANSTASTNGPNGPNGLTGPSSTNTLPGLTLSTSSSTSLSSSAAALNRNRQYTHLAAQLANLNAHLADTENLLRVTSCQAEVVRGLGAWMGGLFMAASRVLGEEGVAVPAAEDAAKDGERHGEREGEED